MRSPLFQQLVAGVLGAAIGALTQGALNNAFGTTVITDGAFWGALVAVAIASLPSIRSMGARVHRSGSPWQQLAAGAVLFLIISAGIILVFFVIFSFYLNLLT